MEPEWGLGRVGFDEILADTGVVQSVIFRDCWTDACFYHEIMMYGMFKGDALELLHGAVLPRPGPEPGSRVQPSTLP